MNLPGFFGETSTDVLGVAHDFAQLGQCLGGKTDGGVRRCVAGNAFFGRLGGRNVVARGTLRDAHACGRQTLNVRVIANRTSDERTLLLTREFLARGEPALEAMSMRAAEL